jgi:voltage-gated potassium channel
MRKIQQHLRFFTYRRLGYPLALSLAILLLGGLGFWVLEPKVETLSDGLWLAFTTAATVGYGGGRRCGQRRARHRTRTHAGNPRPAG